MKTKAILLREDQDSVISNEHEKIGFERKGSAIFMGKDWDVWQGKAG